MKKAIKIFSLLLLMLFAVTFIGCTDDPMDLLLQDAKELVYGMYGEDTTTNNSFEVASQLYVDQERLDITWSVDVKSGTSSEINVVQGSGTDKTLIDIAFIPTSDIKYVLTAVITASNGASTTLTLPEFTVNKPEYMSWDEYAAARDDAIVMVQGVVTAVYTGTASSTTMNFFIQEEGTGLGFYVYGMTKTDKALEDIKVGVTVTAKGVKDTYNGTYEITKAGYRVEDATVKTVTPKDITEEFAAASSSRDGVIAKYQGAYITIKGVDMTGISDQYLRFELNNNTDSYVRVGSSSSIATSEDETALRTKTVAGNGATITGIGGIFSGLLYVMPLNADTITLTDAALTDQERVDAAERRVARLDNTTLTGNISLKAWKEATITWSSSHPDVVSNDGMVNYPETEAATVTLTATITKGEVTKTKVVTVKVEPLATTATIKEVLDLDNGKQVKVKGVVVAVSVRGYVLRDASDMIYVYAHNGTDKTIPAVGTYVQVIGETGYYNVEQLIPSYTLPLTDTAPTLTELTPTVINSTALDNYVAEGGDYDITYVQLEGTISVSGNYTNITVSDTTNQGSVSYATDAIKAECTNGRIATIFGYTIGHSSNRYMNIIVTEVVDKVYTDAEKMVEAKKLADAVATDNCTSNLTLPTDFQGATTTWSSSNTAVIANDGKVTQGDADVEVTLSYTITLAGQTDVTGSVKVVVKQLTLLKVSEVLAKCDANEGEVVYFVAKCVGFDSYGNAYMADETGVIGFSYQFTTDVSLGEVYKVSGRAFIYTHNTDKYIIRRVATPLSADPYTATVNVPDAISNLTAEDLKAINTDGALNQEAVLGTSFMNKIVTFTGTLATATYGSKNSYALVGDDGKTIVTLFHQSSATYPYSTAGYVGSKVTVTGSMIGYSEVLDMWLVSAWDMQLVSSETTLKGAISKTDEVGGSELTATVADQTITFAGTVAYDTEASANNVGVTLAAPTGAVAAEVKYWVNGGSAGSVAATAAGLSLVFPVTDVTKDIVIIVDWSATTAPATYTIKFADGAVLGEAPAVEPDPGTDPEPALEPLTAPVVLDFNSLSGTSELSTGTNIGSGITVKEQTKSYASTDGLPADSSAEKTKCLKFGTSSVDGYVVLEGFTGYFNSISFKGAHWYYTTRNNGGNGSVLTFTATLADGTTEVKTVTITSTVEKTYAAELYTVTFTGNCVSIKIESKAASGGDRRTLIDDLTFSYVAAATE